MVQDDLLLDRYVSGECFGSEVGCDPTTKILVVLSEHVDQIVFSEEFFAKRVAHEHESVGPHIVEDEIGEFRATDEHHEFPDEVVGGEPITGRQIGLDFPELGRLTNK